MRGLVLALVVLSVASPVMARGHRHARAPGVTSASAEPRHGHRHRGKDPEDGFFHPYKGVAITSVYGRRHHGFD